MPLGSNHHRLMWNTAKLAVSGTEVDRQLTGQKKMNAAVVVKLVSINK